MSTRLRVVFAVAVTRLARQVGEVKPLPPVRRFFPRCLAALAAALIAGGSAQAVPRWPELPPAQQAEEVFGLKFRVLLNFKSPAAARTFLEGELQRNPQPYVKAYLAWACFFGPAWGMGPATDPARGLTLAEEAVAAGSVAGQDVLGRALTLGQGLPPNPARGGKLLAAASQSGSMRARSRLGFYQAIGYAVARDPLQAEDSLRRAAELGGITNGYLDLGESYERGVNGMTADLAKATHCYFEAASFADPEGWKRLEVLEQRGVPEAKFHRALSYVHAANEGASLTQARVREQVRILEAIGGDSVEAQFELGRVYLTNDYVGRDDAKADAHLERAIGGAHPGAAFVQAQRKLLGRGVPRDVPSALGELHTLADWGDVRAGAYLGHLYYWGSSDAPGLKKDEGKAFNYTRTAAEGGSFIALVNLAQCYENGIGVAKDYGIAARLYWIAYARGYTKGDDRVRRLLPFVKLP